MPARSSTRRRGHGALVALRERLRRWVHRSPLARGPLTWGSLGLAVVLIGLLAVAAGPDIVAPVLVVVPVLIGGVALGFRPLVLVVVLGAGVLAYDTVELGLMTVRVGTYIVFAVTAAFAVELARTRERLGFPAARGELMLIELRDRLLAHGEIPELPPGWHVDFALRSAGGASFGGDFLVSHLSDDRMQLEVALVDVSGKGVDAATRSLLLSGALGGLLGAVPPERFLPAANDYLLRLGWDEGFATAAHLAVDFTTGRYLLESAGHPPPAHFEAGSGRWRLVELHGRVLGVAASGDFVGEPGVLRPFDALLLYTDGIVEIPGRELSVGIDKLLGEAERLIPRGFHGGAARLISACAPRAADDRAVLLLWRS